MNEELKETRKRSYNLKNIYLDPNNYRFVDDKKYVKIDDNSLLNDKVQKRTRGFIEGNKRENIKDLISSFKANGFMDVDVIQVRDLGNNRYLVIEGNRRVATLKALQEDEEKGFDIGNLNPEIFKKVPFEIHDNESKEKHLIIMGLKHINGNKKWSAINQAQLIYDYLKEYWQADEYTPKETKLCDSLGISKQKLRNSQRAYHLILAYKKSDFGDQFESENYSIFEEITKRPNIKEWLEWDDDSYQALNKNNLHRLFSWISKTEEIEDEDGVEREAIITKSVEVRDLALFIKNEQALKEMEDSRSFARGLVASGEIDKQSYDKTMNELSKTIDKLVTYKDRIDYEDLEQFNEMKNKILDIIPKKSSLNMALGNVSISFEHGKIKHFDSITIAQYKLFKDFKIDKLNRINIFAGFNNSGKSSLLEAVYFLTKQNDIVSFLEIIKLRNKLKSLNPTWVNKVFDKNEIIDIKGVFNEVNTSIYFNKFEASSIDKKDDYIASYSLKSTINDQTLDNIIHTFGYETLRRENEKVVHLCSSILKSPYFYNFDEIKETYSKNTIYKSDEGKTAIRLVVEFLKNEIDSTIEDVRLTDIEDVERFIVDSTQFSDKNLEITNYGEGLQRIFEIALSFAFARNGVVCIDEFETAIHYSLLVKFTKFIQQLADRFNVQVFLTSHSKECIDAFVNNEYRNDEISAYYLENVDSTIKTKFISGVQLKYYINNIGLDIRGDINE
ncbi:MAG: hypothetical protein KU38_04295 [Sulfurovum sp. FS08-3]|nr:MAG: hypothetical protein KU38_04295 [Sulfurovum sp. FS08-3]